MLYYYHHIISYMKGQTLTIFIHGCKHKSCFMHTSSSRAGTSTVVPNLTYVHNNGRSTSTCTTTMYYVLVLYLVRTLYRQRTRRGQGRRCVGQLRTDPFFLRDGDDQATSEETTFCRMQHPHLPAAGTTSGRSLLLYLRSKSRSVASPCCARLEGSSTSIIPNSETPFGIKTFT